MGGMMGTAGAGYPWIPILLWSLLGLAVAMASGVVVGRSAGLDYLQGKACQTSRSRPACPVPGQIRLKSPGQGPA